MSKKEKVYEVKNRKFIGNGMYSFELFGRISNNEFQDSSVESNFVYIDREENKLNLFSYNSGDRPDSVTKTLSEVHDLIDALSKFAIEYTKMHNKVFSQPKKELFNDKPAKGKTPKVKSL